MPWVLPAKIGNLNCHHTWVYSRSVESIWILNNLFSCFPQMFYHKCPCGRVFFLQFKEFSLIISRTFVKHPWKNCNHPGVFTKSEIIWKSVWQDSARSLPLTMGPSVLLRRTSTVARPWLLGSQLMALEGSVQRIVHIHGQVKISRSHKPGSKRLPQVYSKQVVSECLIIVCAHN